MTVTAQQDILWLQISVHNVHIVQVLQSQCNLYKATMRNRTPQQFAKSYLANVHSNPVLR
jgi:hypothetical protein